MTKRDWCYVSARPKKKIKIDREDRERVDKHAWRVTTSQTGRERVVTSIRGPAGNRSITLGKFLMKPPKGKQVYPRRFNQGLDYRKGNLIVCTLRERQQQLPKKRTKTTSRYRGVSFIKATGSWRAAIQVDGRSITIGRFKDERLAAMSYNVAARKHFGANAYQNVLFPQKHRKGDR